MEVIHLLACKRVNTLNIRHIATVGRIHAQGELVVGGSLQSLSNSGGSTSVGGTFSIFIASLLQVWAQVKAFVTDGQPLFLIRQVGQTLGARPRSGLQTVGSGFQFYYGDSGQCSLYFVQFNGEIFTEQACMLIILAIAFSAYPIHVLQWVQRSYQGTCSRSWKAKIHPIGGL